MILNAIQRGLSDSFKGQLSALIFLVAGGLISLLYLYATESATVAAEEIPYVTGAIVGGLGALALWILLNLIAAPYRIKNDTIKALKDDLHDLHSRIGDHSRPRFVVKAPRLTRDTDAQSFSFVIPFENIGLPAAKVTISIFHESDSVLKYLGTRTLGRFERNECSYWSADVKIPPCQNPPGETICIAFCSEDLTGNCHQDFKALKWMGINNGKVWADLSQIELSDENAMLAQVRSEYPDTLAFKD